MARNISTAEAIVFLLEAATFEGGSVSSRAAQYKRALRALDRIGVFYKGDRDHILCWIGFQDAAGRLNPRLAEYLDRQPASRPTPTATPSAEAMADMRRLAEEECAALHGAAS